MMPVTHIFFCAWLKTQWKHASQAPSQTPLRHKWKPGLKIVIAAQDREIYFDYYKSFKNNKCMLMALKILKL